ncbi:hypothetical protein ALI22I_01180 [Saccharothrix sp. ALI-22-I]|uniref:hypothetical protein n=1 Tax=Saccharothrix sp. ALI-22-I TaxID=1933778 RepID=UPI00097C863D|nr:hypothetical protein [Saccharothrix sp. ALI-22-I]ONI92916.1 hypothetical protein ALI22I_01180 [Saccharothrix sp. ALI-22-I]
MTVSSNSRYRQQTAYTAAAADGTPRPTLPIRRTPPPASATHRHRVSGVEDVEYLAWRYLRDSEAWWTVTDANPIAFPLDLRAGDVIDVPIGARADRTDRTRVFR